MVAGLRVAANEFLTLAKKFAKLRTDVAIVSKSREKPC